MLLLKVLLTAYAETQKTTEKRSNDQQQKKKKKKKSSDCKNKMWEWMI